jgi:hypothetical protein
MLRREILLWHLITQQRHPHIQPLIGITNSEFPNTRMVAPWQDNGNISDFVQKPAAAQTNRLRLVRFSSCSGIHCSQSLKFNEAGTSMFCTSVPSQSRASGSPRRSQMCTCLTNPTFSSCLHLTLSGKCFGRSGR